MHCCLKRLIYIKTNFFLYLVHLLKSYIYLYIWEHWWEQNIFCSFTIPQAFWQSSALGALCTLGTSVVLYSLPQATLMSPAKEETRVCGHIYIYILYMVFIWAKIFPFHIDSWPEWDSNPWPCAYRAHALTTELSSQTMSGA